MGKTIAIMSLKGGVGKTSATVALGKAIANFGKSVLLIDGDFSSPNLGFHLNIMNPEKTVNGVLNNLVTAKDAIYEVGNLHVLPSSLFEDSLINPMKLKDKIKTLKNKYDYILIDSAPSLSEEALGPMLASDEILFVTTPDYTTLGTTIKSVNLAKKRGIPVSGIIMNKVYGKDFELSIKDIEDISDVPVMAMIPHDIDVMKAQSQFLPSTEFKENSKGSKEYKRLAATLIGEKHHPFSVLEMFRMMTPTRTDVNRELYYTRVFA